MAGRVAYHGGLVTDGLILHLDAARKPSYPGSGDVCYDLTPNQYTGSLVNGTTFEKNRNSGTFSFDGSNDYIEIGYEGDLSTNSYTFSFAAKHRGFRNNRRTMMGLSSGSQYAFFTYNMQIWESDTQFLSFYGNGSSYTTYTFNLDQPFYEWNYFTSVQTPTSMHTYVNGVLKSSITSVTLRNDFDRIWIGQRGGQYWTGWIPEFRMYNRALSAEEVLQNYNALKGRFGL